MTLEQCKQKASELNEDLEQCVCTQCGEQEVLWEGTDVFGPLMIVGTCDECSQ